MILETLPKKVHPFLKKQKIQPTFWKQLHLGRNSRIWQLEQEDLKWILKEYFHHPRDRRDRLKAEAGFLAFLEKQQIDCVPTLFAHDRQAHLGLYSYLQGNRVQKITCEHIEQAADFIIRLNRVRNRKGSENLPRASEACFQQSEHFELISTRVRNLMEIPLISPIYDQAREWIRQVLQPALDKAFRGLIVKKANLDQEIAPADRILSPSDYGFHNMLEEKGKLFFFDFEYAGWDDVAKLCCDFACQPDQPISGRQAMQFWKLVTSELCLKDSKERVYQLLPLYRIKWCCIILNEFSNTGQSRRQHAGHQLTSLLGSQLSKAQHYFQQHLE